MKIEDLKLNFGCAFHDDKHFIPIVTDILKGCDYFIETGSWEGDTTGFVADNFPAIQCVTCEADVGRYNITKKATERFSNVTAYNITSPDIFKVLPKIDPKMNEKVCAFWLDAHGWGFRWPLLDEINIITQNFSKCYILIDDFKNPYVPEMQYHQYDGQFCTLEYIKPYIHNIESFEVYYPTYREHTSKCNGLIGWGLLTNIRTGTLPSALKQLVDKKYKFGNMVV